MVPARRGRRTAQPLRDASHGARRRARARRVESIDSDLFHVVVVRCSSGGLPGERLAYVRATLYATKANAERRAFGEVLALLWGDR